VLRKKRAIAGGGRVLQHVIFQAARVTAHHSPTRKAFAQRLRQVGKPHKVIIVACKPVTIANAQVAEAVGCSNQLNDTVAKACRERSHNCRQPEHPDCRHRDGGYSQHVGKDFDLDRGTHVCSPTRLTLCSHLAGLL